MTSFELVPGYSVHHMSSVHSTRYMENILWLQVGYLTDIMY